MTDRNFQPNPFMRSHLVRKGGALPSPVVGYITLHLVITWTTLKLGKLM